MVNKNHKSLEAIYREAREKEGPIIIPPQIHPDYWEKIQKMFLAESLIDLLKKYQIYKKRAKEYPGKNIQGNVILGAPPEYYEPSEEEKRLSEIGTAIKLLLPTFKSREKCHELINDLLKGPTIDQIDYIQYRFYHVDVVGSGRFIYPEKGVPQKFSLIDNIFQTQNLSGTSDKQKSISDQYLDLLELLKSIS